MTAARRAITGAILLAAFGIAPLVSWLCLLASAREDQRDADDIETLSALAAGRPVDLPHARIFAAIERLSAEGQITRSTPGQRYLTRAGWARIGRPLSDRLIGRLRQRNEGWYIENAARQELMQRGLMVLTDRGGGDGCELTPAGRAVLEEAS